MNKEGASCWHKTVIIAEVFNCSMMLSYNLILHWECNKHAGYILLIWTNLQQYSAVASVPQTCFYHWY